MEEVRANTASWMQDPNVATAPIGKRFKNDFSRYDIDNEMSPVQVLGRAGVIIVVLLFLGLVCALTMLAMDVEPAPAKVGYVVQRSGLTKPISRLQSFDKMWSTPRMQMIVKAVTFVRDENVMEDIDLLVFLGEVIDKVFAEKKDKINEIIDLFVEECIEERGLPTSTCGINAVMYNLYRCELSDEGVVNMLYELANDE